MSLFFLYPAFLIGLLAASLPVLIHLLNRRRLQRIRFPAVRFILLSQKRISRSYRLRHWLLLALRTLAIVCLVLLLANPIFQTGAGLFAGGGPVSLVVLLDNSLSMTWSGDGNGFARAKEAARLLVSGLNEGDRAALVPTSLTGKETYRLKSQKDVLSREIDAVEVADGAANFAAALEKAYEILSEPAAQKEIRVITDMGLTGWDRFSIAALKRVDPSIPVKVIRIGRDRQPLNATIKSVALGTPGIGVNLPLHIEARLTNFGDREIKDMLVQLSIGGQNKEQKLATLPPRGDVTVNFQTRLTQAGANTGQVILKKEGLAGNSVLNFTLDAQEKVRVLVVDGDPQTSLVQSDSFFLSRALNPSGEQGSSLFLPTVILADGLSSAALESYEAVILCNVAALPDAFADQLLAFVRRGGGLLIFGGDKLQPESYNQKLAQAAPAQLREKKSGTEANSEKIARFDADHPALQFLSDSILVESLYSIRVWGYARAEARGKPLLALANGDPLVAEQKFGEGKVMLVTTTADRDWTDMPLKTAYLPLIQSLTQYLAGGKRGQLDPGIEVNTAKQISLPAALVGKGLKVTNPAKQDQEVPIEAQKDRAVAVVTDNHRAGIYRLSVPPGASRDAGSPGLYAVNRPFLESRLEEIGERELQAKLDPVRAEVIPAEALKEGGKRTDLALPLLAFLIVTLLLEGWLGQRF